MSEINPNICFIVDATGSMSSTLIALKEVFSQLFPIAPLLVKAKFHLIIYRDFDCLEGDVYQYHGPFTNQDMNTIVNIINATQAMGGSDPPECQKFAFWRLLDDVPQDNRVVFHFTDAPPHSYPFPTRGNDNHFKEGLKLKVNSMDPDWVVLSKEFQRQTTPVYTIGQIRQGLNYYTLLAELTGGEMVSLKNVQTTTILKTTVILFARAFGYDECNLYQLASVNRCTNSNDLPTTENTPEFQGLPIQTFEFTIDNQDLGIKQAYTELVQRKILETRYQSSAEYQIQCFDTFTQLIRNGHILALTYNPLLGCLYRLMCRRSKIAETEKKREELNTLISNTVSSLKSSGNKATYEQVATWMEESYNRIEEINEMIMTMEAPIVPFLGLQTTRRMTKKELTLACKIPLPPNLQMLGELVSSIVVVDSKPKNMPEVFVPLGLENPFLFSMLSHLMCPGVRLDSKPSTILALVTLNSGNAILADRALSFLRAGRGKWFDKEGSEWYLFGIIKLILRLEKQYSGIITEEEKSLFQDLLHISALKYNNSEIDCQRKFRLNPVRGIKYPDYKIYCQMCHQFRSASIMTPDGCGICVSWNSMENKDMAPLEDSDQKKSYLFDCSICNGRYAVRDLDGLNVKPKCHYCRLQPPCPPDQIPTVACHVCEVKMVLPNQSHLDLNQAAKYMCEVCVENGGEERIETIQVRLHDLLSENQWLIPDLLGLDIDFKLLIGRESLFSIRDKYKEAMGLDVDENPRVLKYQDRNLLNGEEILQKLRDIVVTGSVGTESCIVCYNDFIHHELDSFCYNKNCQARGCFKCIKNWFSENKPGSRVLQNRTKCPCCKQIPTKGLAFGDPCFKTLINQKVTYDPDWHYAWCKACGKVKEYMEYQCAGPDPMEINNYICEDCMSPGEHKKCPFCGIPTAKYAGCDHMECPSDLGGCGIHWCYRCEGTEVFSSNIEQDVYDHLHDVHGNIWGAEH